MSLKPLAIDLYAGLGGWASGFLAEGYGVIGFDIERHDYGTGGYPGQLILQDVLTLCGSQFRNAAVIVASPPCTEYSYMAMPWSRGKQIARALCGKGDFPEGYKGSRTVKQLNALFNACFRIQREACEAAGCYIPIIVENVRGAQRWVGRARWHFGSYYLWGDVPALMPIVLGRKTPAGSRDKNATGVKCGDRCIDRSTGKWTSAWNLPEREKERGVKSFTPSGEPLGKNTLGMYGSKSPQRKLASAEIAKIPLPLAQHIARSFKP